MFANEPGECVKAAEALVAGGVATLALLFQMRQELSDQLARQVGDAQAVDGLLQLPCDEGKKQCEHVSVTALGVDREVAFVDEMLEEKSPYPGSEQTRVGHD
jgi:hypothetical protein